MEQRLAKQFFTDTPPIGFEHEMAIGHRRCQRFVAWIARYPVSSPMSLRLARLWKRLSHEWANRSPPGFGQWGIDGDAG